MNKTKAYRIASTHFLTEELPLNRDRACVDWMTKDKDGEVMKFVSENMIEPFEGYSPLEVWESIHFLAQDFLRYCNGDDDDGGDVDQIELDFDDRV